MLFADFHHQRKNHMKQLSLWQVADRFKTATIEHTADHGHAMVHTGTTEAGEKFGLVNDCDGHSCVSHQP